MNEKYQILDASGGVDYKAYSAARSVLRKRLERLVAKQPDNARAANILQKLKQQMTVKDIRSMSEPAQKRAAEKSNQTVLRLHVTENAGKQDKTSQSNK